MMTEIAQKLRKNDEWIVIELNPAIDLLKGLLSKLNSNHYDFREDKEKWKEIIDYNR